MILIYTVFKSDHRFEHFFNLTLKLLLGFIKRFNFFKNICYTVFHQDTGNGQSDEQSLSRMNLNYGVACETLGADPPMFALRLLLMLLNQQNDFAKLLNEFMHGGLCSSLVASCPSMKLGPSVLNQSEAQEDVKAECPYSASFFFSIVPSEERVYATTYRKSAAHSVLFFVRLLRVRTFQKDAGVITVEPQCPASTFLPEKNVIWTHAPSQ